MVASRLSDNAHKFKGTVVLDGGSIKVYCTPSTGERETRSRL